MVLVKKGEKRKINTLKLISLCCYNITIDYKMLFQHPNSTAKVSNEVPYVDFVYTGRFEIVFLIQTHPLK